MKEGKYDEYDKIKEFMNTIYKRKRRQKDM